eukprot:6996842-Alexandrium_andersonii.AAC.1
MIRALAPPRSRAHKCGCIFAPGRADTRSLSPQPHASGIAQARASAHRTPSASRAWTGVHAEQSELDESDHFFL